MTGAYTAESVRPVGDAETTVYAPLAPAGAGANATNYQVDFAAGHPIESRSADSPYAGQDRLFRFAFGTAEDGITETDSAWPGPRMRGCLAGSGISGGDDGTVEATFTVGEGCELTLSLVVYSMPGDEFDASTADQQELLDATTGTFDPGEHTITVDVPTDEDDGGDD